MPSKNAIVVLAIGIALAGCARRRGDGDGSESPTPLDSTSSARAPEEAIVEPAAEGPNEAPDEAAPVDGREAVIAYCSEEYDGPEGYVVEAHPAGDRLALPDGATVTVGYAPSTFWQSQSGYMFRLTPRPDGAVDCEAEVRRGPLRFWDPPQPRERRVYRTTLSRERAGPVVEMVCALPSISLRERDTLPPPEPEIRQNADGSETFVFRSRGMELGLRDSDFWVRVEVAAEDGTSLFAREYSGMQGGSKQVEYLPLRAVAKAAVEMGGDYEGWELVSEEVEP